MNAGLVGMIKPVHSMLRALNRVKDHFELHSTHPPSDHCCSKE